jgi:hypothetical protein
MNPERQLTKIGFGLQARASPHDLFIPAMKHLKAILP